MFLYRLTACNFAWKFLHTPGTDRLSFSRHGNFSSPLPSLRFVEQSADLGVGRDGAFPSFLSYAPPDGRIFLRQMVLSRVEANSTAATSRNGFLIILRYALVPPICYCTPLNHHTSSSMTSALCIISQLMKFLLSLSLSLLLS